MIEMKSTVREWGRSFGMVFPKDKAKQLGVKKDDVVHILVMKKNTALKDTFGTFKFKKTTQEILDESDKQNWDE